MKPESAGTIPESDDAAEEAALVRRIVAGEGHRYSVLVDRYQRRLYWSCLRLVGDPDEAEDVVQEAFVRAYERLVDFDPIKAEVNVPERRLERASPGTKTGAGQPRQ